jgi:UDP-2,3-diacylglucosamine pyrophosphatase LpxH
LVALARADGVDGVICGHFHIAALHDDHGLTYANCGDWVDSFTALAEGFDGRLRLIGGRAALAPRPGTAALPAGALGA